MKSVYSAIPTPFFDGKIDFSSLQKLIEFQIKNGIEGFVVSGSTGEGHSLTKEEYIDLINFCSAYSRKLNKNVDIVAGIGCNILNNAVEYVSICNSLDIDYILATTPYYNKPQQDGIYRYFEQISHLSKKDIILYNVPSRTATDMSNDTIVKLAKNCSNIIALKDASGIIGRVIDLKFKLFQNNIDDFSILSGEDALQIAFNAVGGSGVISVVSNIAPQLCCEIQNLTKSNKFIEANNLQNQLLELSNAMFCETNPVPVKYALKKYCIFKSDEVRLPLIELNSKSRKYIDGIIEKYLCKYN